MPLVAVIIPAFNRAHLLERAIKSVLDQTLRDFEVMIVDDGSTDATHDLPVLKHPDPRLRCIRFLENRGVSTARNAGVEATTAPLLAFLDSDDEWLPSKLERQVHWMENNQGSFIVQTKEIWIRDNRRVNPPKTHEKFRGDLFSASLERCMITPSSVLLTRALFKESGGFNQSLPACEDYDLWLKITCHYPVGLVDEYLLIRYGGHADQLSRTVPVLDRFRIQSLIDLLSSGRLSPEQTRQARECVLKRSRIVSTGYLNHGNRTEYERYLEIIKRYA
jgi:glycosyltransferase involved in cell wall biosynthesis